MATPNLFLISLQAFLASWVGKWAKNKTMNAIVEKQSDPKRNKETVDELAEDVSENNFNPQTSSSPKDKDTGSELKGIKENMKKKKWSKMSSNVQNVIKNQRRRKL